MTKKRRIAMKLALAFDPDSGRVYRDFESTKVLKIYTVEGDTVTESEMVGTMAESTEDIIGVAMMMEADCILCGDILPESRELLDNEGIVFYSGFYGNADDAVSDFVNGYVVFGPDE